MSSASRISDQEFLEYLNIIYYMQNKKIDLKGCWKILECCLCINLNSKYPTKGGSYTVHRIVALHYLESQNNLNIRIYTINHKLLEYHVHVFITKVYEKIMQYTVHRQLEAAFIEIPQGPEAVEVKTTIVVPVPSQLLLVHHPLSAILSSIRPALSL